MNIIRCNDENEVIKTINSLCQDLVEKEGITSMYIPAGGTLIPVYNFWEQTHPNYLNALKLQQIDEVVTSDKKGMFKKFFEKHLPSYQKQISYIQQDSELCEIAILGLGLNGHVAFHEPHMPNNFQLGSVDLSEITCKNLELPAGTKGLSFGAEAFLKSKKIIMVVLGQAKKEILHEVLNGNSKLPASLLLSHKDLTIITDKDAY